MGVPSWAVNDANLEGYWKLDSDGTDSSTNSYDLTEQGTPLSYVTGKLGNAVDLESGGTQYLDIADGSCANLEISGDQTWMAWVKPESGGLRHIMAKNSFVNHANTRARFIRSQSDNQAIFRLQGLSTNDFVTSGGTMTNGSWYHIAGVYDQSAGSIKVYLDGVGSALACSGTPPDTDGDFCIGANKNTAGDGVSQQYDGVVDSAMIFSRALTDDEITQLSRFSPTPADTVNITDTLYNESVGTTAEVAVSDTLGITDTVDSEAIILISITQDSVGITDTSVATTAIRRAVEDTLPVSDTILRTVNVSRSVADDLGITDTVAGINVVTLLRGLTDDVGISDALQQIIKEAGKRNIRVSIVDKTKRISGSVRY